MKPKSADNIQSSRSYEYWDSFPMFFPSVLEEQVEQGRKHADQFKAMSAANEEALKELNKVSSRCYPLPDLPIPLPPY